MLYYFLATPEHGTFAVEAPDLHSAQLSVTKRSGVSVKDQTALFGGNGYTREEAERTGLI
jgi:hypothetical protein